MPRPSQALDDVAIRQVVDGMDARRDEMLKQVAAVRAVEPVILNQVKFALACYWMNQRLSEADEAIMKVCSPGALRSRGKQDARTTEHSPYKQLYLLHRVYFLFNSRSEHFPGRMGAAAQRAVEETSWQWISTALRKQMLLPQYDWWFWGTENHHSIMWCSLWGASQIVAAHPEYRNQRYADGTPVVEMAQAFDDYFKRVMREKAGKGLLVECASGYNRWTLNGLYNIADFSPDPVARRRVKMFLDLYWADWAIEQIDGVRGGSRHRCYFGESSTDGGEEAAAWYLFGLGDKGTSNPAILGAATTFYRPDPVVVDLVYDVNGRGTYSYVSRRPGLGKSYSANEPRPRYVQDENAFIATASNVLNPQGGNLLRYTWCTPDFVMGTSMVPALQLDDWTRISSQNRWEGVIFGGHETARIFVQSLKLKKGSVYNAHWSAQNKGVMIVQRLKQSNAKGQRVWFDGALTRAEDGGWIFAQAPRAYAAVRVVAGKTDWQPDTLDQHLEGKGTAKEGMWLNCQDEFSPIIIEVAPRDAYPDFAGFQRAIRANRLTWKDKRLDYRSDLYKTQLTFFADYSHPPQVDGKPVNYNAPKAYDSPFIRGDFGAGIVTIQKDQRQVVLDFTRE